MCQSSFCTGDSLHCTVLQCMHACQGVHTAACHPVREEIGLIRSGAEDGMHELVLLDDAILRARKPLSADRSGTYSTLSMPGHRQPP